MHDERDEQALNEKANKLAFQWFVWTAFACFAYFAAVFLFVI
jgi:ABC-type multidrug transport system permease subunit